jgi:hypothetical protein
MTKKPIHSTSKSPAVKPAIPRIRREKLDEAFGTDSLWRIGTQAKKGQYVSGEELAAAIEANSGEPLPDDARDYLCRFLRGQVKKKRGPQKKPFSYSALITDLFIPIFYQEELRRFQKLRKAQGRGAKGDLSPHELAVRSVQKRFKRYAMITPRRLANILSSRKLGR